MSSSVGSEYFQWKTMGVQDLPSLLWGLYMEYLWDPAPNTWVARIAYVFRIVSLMFAFPFALLTLFDIMSYLVARTLGVVETTRASTSNEGPLKVPVSASGGIDEKSRSQTPTPGPQSIEEVVSGLGEQDPDAIGHPNLHPTLHVQKPDTNLDTGKSAAAPATYFFSPTDEGNLELSGGNILSPAMSRQGSPPDSSPVGEGDGLRRRGGADASQLVE